MLKFLRMQVDKKIFENKKVAVITNRAPVSPITRNNSTFLQRSIGGLVAALEPIVGQFDGKWFCTISKNSKLSKMSLKDLPYEVRYIELTEAEQTKYYEGYSNNQLWPIFHYFQTNCIFNEEDWDYYKSVNERMADLILENIDDDYYVWVHDYHFMLLPGILRRRNPKLKIGFFLHTPFPNQELFRLLTHRKDLLEGLLGANLIGFHTKQYVEHFVDSVRLLVPEFEKEAGKNIFAFRDHKAQIEHFPISIDFEHINQIAESEKVIKKTEKLRTAFQSDIIGISVDRLDYTKGIKERLLSIEYFFDKYPEYQTKVTFIQLSVPSRIKVEAYQTIKREVDELVGRINGKFSKDAWRPIFYMFGTLPFDELVAYYSLSDFALVVPLRDGMNLVAKEYIASNISKNGVLILSEFTGAAEEFKESILVNPYQCELVAQSIKDAIEMNPVEKTLRMRELLKKVKKNDVYNWLNKYFISFDEAIKTNKQKQIKRSKKLIRAY